MNNPKVSICIPTYNGEKFLRQCLDTCLAQSYGNYELVICDDGSTDDTIKIIQEYADRQATIRFYENNKNLGLVGNWNKCIEKAEGEWIKFVFQDDYMTENCVAEFVKAIDKDTVFMVCERNFILPENPTKEQVEYYTQTVRTLTNTIDQEKLFYSAQTISRAAMKNMGMNFIAEPSLIFFKKELLKELGHFNSALKQICDFEFALRASSKHGLKYIPQQLCSFRIHANSTTNTNIKNKYFELRYLEPLLLAACMLFGKEFIDFRNHLKFSQVWKLKIYFYVKTYQAYQVNLKQNQQNYYFTEFNTEFPEIYKNRKGNFFVRIVGAVL